MQAQRTHNMITMKYYYSVLVFIALLSAHLVLANKTQHHLREQLRRQAPGTPSRRGKPSDANASAVGKHHQVRRRLPKAKINLEPSTSPSDLPSISPSNLPSHLPTMQPTNPPSAAPSRKPTQPPSPPTQVLATSSPSSTPTSAPTNKPTLPDCDDYDEVMDKAYTEGDKVRVEVQLYVCMFSSCDWSKLDRSGHWGTPNPAFCVLDNNLTTQQSSSSPSLSSSNQPSSGPTNKPNTLPDCPGSEYSENSEPLFQHGNFTYYSSNGQDYEYYQCIPYEDGACNEGSSPGRPNWYGRGYCKLLSLDDMSSNEISNENFGCPTLWNTSVEYEQNDSVSVEDSTDGTIVIYKCVPDICNLIGPDSGPQSDDVWIVNGVCLDGVVFGR